MWPAQLYIICPHYITNGKVIAGKGGGVIEPKMCVLIFSATLSEPFLVRRGTEGYTVVNLDMSAGEVPVVVRF